MGDGINDAPAMRKCSSICNSTAIFTFLMSSCNGSCTIGFLYIFNTNNNCLYGISYRS